MKDIFYTIIALIILFIVCPLSAKTFGGTLFIAIPSFVFAMYLLGKVFINE